MNEDLIYIIENQIAVGPFTSNQILQMIQSGRINASTLACRSGMREWKRLSDFTPHVFPILSMPIHSPAPQVQSLNLTSSGFQFFSLKYSMLLIAGLLVLLFLQNRSHYQDEKQKELEEVKRQALQAGERQMEQLKNLAR